MDFKVSQDPKEIDDLRKAVGPITSYLEIGSYAGESLLFMAKNFAEGAHVTLIDLPVNQAARQNLVDIVKELQKYYTVTLISADSRDPVVVQKARELAPNGYYDLVFIDGNHDFEYVISDLANYGPMGKLIAMHDVDPRAIQANVQKHGFEKPSAAHVWQAVRLCRDTQEFINPDSLKPRGLGLLRGISIGHGK